MSTQSGDTSRAHRLRKQNIRRRARIRDLRKQLEAAKSTPTTPSAK